MQPLEFTVAFDEADGEGIVFFGNYFRLAHRAMEGYIPQLNISWREWFANPDWGVPLRHVEADYLQPLRPGDTFRAHVWVEKIGETSVHFGYEFRDAHDRPTTRLKTSHVFMSRVGRQKCALPDSIRARLERGLRSAAQG